MLKQYVAKMIVAVTVVAFVAGGSGVVADALGLDVTPAALAGDCNQSGSGGGGC